VFWSSHFYGPECHRFTRTMPLVLSKQAYLKDLSSQKLLIVNLGARMLTEQRFIT